MHGHIYILYNYIIRIIIIFDTIIEDVILRHILCRVDVTRGRHMLITRMRRRCEKPPFTLRSSLSAREVAKRSPGNGGEDSRSSEGRKSRKGA